MRPETVPLVVVALLLLSTQPGVDSFTTVVGGSQDVETENDAVLVVDGNVTIPAGTTTETSLYVLDGTAQIDGTVDGEVVQFAGRVDVGGEATVTGTFRAFGGTQDVAAGASVVVDRVAEPLTAERTPAQRVGTLLLQALGLGAVAFLVGRRAPDLLGTVGHSVRHHPVVSATVGLLASVSLLALFVFMAFTIVLLPVSLLGLLGGVLVVGYAYLAVGHLLGEWLVAGRLGVAADRPGLATALGTVAFLLASEALGVVPVVGGLLPAAVLLTALGAVLVTYFGLRAFHPPTLGPVEE